MKVIDQAIGRGNAPHGSPRARWKPVRRLAVFAAVALALILGAGASFSPAHASDIAVVGVIGAVVGFFILRMIAQAPRRTYFHYSDGMPAYPNSFQAGAATNDEAISGIFFGDLQEEFMMAQMGFEPYATIYGFHD